MSKKFLNTRCIYCLGFFEELTSDHVLPQSWQPASTPGNLEKWQVPACKKCNARYGKLENDLLRTVGLCLDPGEEKSFGIPDKALRSIDPKSAKNEKDRLHRQMRKAKVVREIGHLLERNVPKESIFPNFGPSVGEAPDDWLPIQVSKATLEAVGEKLVRGIMYVVDKRYIEADQKIDVFFLWKENAHEIVDLINRFGKEHHCGPGIRIGAAFAPDDPQSGLFVIDIWGKLCMYATVESVCKE